MIKVFGQADTSFSSNGDIVIQPFKALVHKVDNGDFYLDFECSPDFLDYVVSNNIIVAPDSLCLLEQLSQSRVAQRL